MFISKRRFIFILVSLLCIYFILFHTLSLQKDNAERVINFNQEPLIDSKNLVTEKSHKPYLNRFDLNQEPLENYTSIQCRKSKPIFVQTILCIHDLTRDSFVK